MRNSDMQNFFKPFSFFAALIFLGGAVANLQGNDDWVIGVDEASKAAETEGKDLLVNFTGSDWCKFCIQLEKEVFGEEEFVTAAKKHFVLVTVDFPNDRSNQSEELQQKNEEWKQKFSVSGFPTVALLDRQKRPYGFMGYQPGGVEPFLAALNELRESRVKRDEFFAQAEKAKGIERAKLLDQALSQMNEDLATVYYENVINEIVELDKDNEAGLRNKYNEAKFKELYKAVLTDVTMYSRLLEPTKALTFIDEVLSEVDLPPAYLLKVNQIKFDLLRRAKKIDEAESLIDEMLKIDGVSEDPVLTQRLLVRKAYLFVGAERKKEAYELLDSKIRQMQDNLYLYVAKGELLDADKEYEKAVSAYDNAIQAASSDPELMQTLISAKADALFELKKYDEAVRILNDFALSDRWPADLRSDCLLHKAIVLREQAEIEKRPTLKRAAIIAENKAIEIVETSSEKSERQKLVEKLRKRYGG